MMDFCRAQNPTGEKEDLILKVLKQHPAAGVPSCFHAGMKVSGICLLTVHISPDDTQMRSSWSFTVRLCLLRTAEPEDAASQREITESRKRAA